MLAGIGTKHYANAAEAVDALISVTDTVEPDADTHRIYADTYAIYRSLYPQLKESFGALTEMATTVMEDEK